MLNILRIRVFIPSLIITDVQRSLAASRGCTYQSTFGVSALLDDVLSLQDINSYLVLSDLWLAMIYSEALDWRPPRTLSHSLDCRNRDRP